VHGRRRCNVEGKKIIQLHGSPTDNNATLFKQGYQDAIEGSGIETVGEEPCRTGTTPRVA
jgi:ABC-type xylose transport system substrate-binding protein